VVEEPFEVEDEVEGEVEEEEVGEVGRFTLDASPPLLLPLLLLSATAAEG
jgi:hypothetical protein